MATVPLTEELTEQTEEAKSLWKSFIDSVYDLFKKLFGIERGKTLYQEAVNVITNKLSQPGAGATKTTTVTETVEEFPPVEAVTDPELEALLKAKYNEIVEELTPEERMGMSYDSWKQSDSTALGIVRKYKADKIKKAAADVDTEEKGIMTLADKKKRFTALGYTLAEMNTMSEDAVNDILKNNTKKTLVIDVIENGKKVGKVRGKILGKENVILQRGFLDPSNKELVRAGNTKGGRKTGLIEGRKNVEEGRGIWDPSNQQKLSEWGSKGGTNVNKQKWKSTKDGYISTACGVANHNIARGWDSAAKVRIND
jgi:hypothetical protein